MEGERQRERGHEDEVATLITPETCGSRTASIVKADDDLEQNVLMSDNGCHGAEMEEGLSSHVKKRTSPPSPTNNNYLTQEF